MEIDQSNNCVCVLIIVSIVNNCINPLHILQVLSADL